LALELIRISKAVGGGWCESASSGEGPAPASQKLTSENRLFPVPKKPSSEKLSEPASESEKKETKETTKETSEKPSDPKSAKSTTLNPNAVPKAPAQGDPSGKSTLSDPVTVDPIAVDPVSVYSITVAPVTAYPVTSDPNTTDPNAVDPNTTDSETLWGLPAPSESQTYPDTQLPAVSYVDMSRAFSPPLPNIALPEISPPNIALPNIALPNITPPNMTLPNRLAVSQTRGQLSWRKLATGLLSVVVAGLSLLLLSMLTRRATLVFGVDQKPGKPQQQKGGRGRLWNRLTRGGT